MNSRSFAVLSLAASSLLLPAGKAFADERSAIAARLEAADTSNSLSSSDLKPWHIKMEVQIFDESGAPTNSGTIEEWWSSPNSYRREYVTAAYKQAEVFRDGMLFRSTDAGAPPHSLKLLLTQAIHPMPSSAEINQSDPKMKTVHFGKTPLECVMLTQPLKYLPDPPIGLFPTYCFDPGKNILRASLHLGDESIQLNKIGTFQGRYVATDIAVRAGSATLASAKVTTLQTEDLDSSLLQPLARTEDPKLDTVSVSQNVVAGTVLSRPNPVYPAAAKDAHVSGSVTLHAVIGTDGHVSELTVVSTPDPLLALSAVTAVRQWRYKPYYLNGRPVEVDSMITVNFQFH